MHEDSLACMLPLVRRSHEKSDNPPLTTSTNRTGFCCACRGWLMAWGSDLSGKTAADWHCGPAAETVGRRRVAVARPGRLLLALPRPPARRWRARTRPSTLGWSRSRPPIRCPGFHWAGQCCPSPRPQNLDGQDESLHRTLWVAAPEATRPHAASSPAHAVRPTSNKCFCLSALSFVDTFWIALKGWSRNDSKFPLLNEIAIVRESMKVGLGYDKLHFFYLLLLCGHCASHSLAR